MSDAPSTEQILADARLVAVFFRGVLNEGVPLRSAELLTCSYLNAVVSARTANKPPREPWEPDSP